MAIQIGPQEIAKVAGEVGIPADVLQKIFAEGLLNETRALNLAIRFDYMRMARGPRKNRLKPSDIKEALAQYYRVPISRVQNTVASKRDKYLYCPQCGRRSTSKELKTYDGICYKCALDELNREIDGEIRSNED